MYFWNRERLERLPLLIIVTMNILPSFNKKNAKYLDLISIWNEKSWMKSSSFCNRASGFDGYTGQKTNQHKQLLMNNYS